MGTAEHYEILGLTDQASAEEIKRAYRSLIRRLHPDMPGGDAAGAAAVQAAWTILGDPVKRAEYDKVRNEPEPAATVADEPDFEPDWGSTSTSWGQTVDGDVVEDEDAQPAPEPPPVVEPGPVRLVGGPRFGFGWLVPVVMVAAAGWAYLTDPALVLVLVALVAGVTGCAYLGYKPFGRLSGLGAVAAFASVPPMAGWLVGTWPMVAWLLLVAGYCLVRLVIDALACRRSYPFTRTQRVVTTTGEPVPKLLHDCMNSAGYVGVVGPAQFGHGLLSGDHMLRVHVVPERPPGTTYLWEHGRLMAFRPGSRLGSAVPGLDLAAGLPGAGPRVSTTFMVWAPGSARSAAPDDKTMPAVVGDAAMVQAVAGHRRKRVRYADVDEAMGLVSG